MLKIKYVKNLPTFSEIYKLHGKINNSKILRIQNAKLSGYCFHININNRVIFKSVLVYI